MEVEQITSTQDAESYEQHKALRSAKPSETPVTTPEPVSTEKPVEKATEGDRAADSVLESEQSDTDGQPEKQDKSGKPVDKKTGAAARFKELTDRAKKAEEERDALRRDLEQARAAKPGEATPPARTEPKPEEKASEDPKPRLKDFVDKLKAGETYEDAVERHSEAMLDYRDRQRQANDAKTATERRNAGIRESINAKLTDARGKYADFDQVTAGDTKAGTGFIISPPMQQFFIDHPQGADVMYELAKNPAEHKRIGALPPTLQIAELAYLAKGSAPAAEKKAAPVSKAPPPPRTVGGTATPPAKDTAEASSYEEHKRLRRAN